MKKILFLIFPILLFHGLMAVEKIAVSLEKKEIFFGEENHLFLDKTFDGEVTASFKSESDKFFISEPFKNDNGKWEITITPLDFGELETPEVLINNNGNTYSAGKISFKVKANTDEKDNKLSDMWGMVDYYVETYVILYALAVVTLLMVAVFILFKLKTRKKQAFAELIKEFTPKEVALLYLEKAQNCYLNNDEHGYIDSISMGIKFYLGKRLDSNIPEMTTGELKRYIKRNVSDEVAVKEIVFIMNNCDAFKFAGVSMEKTVYDSLINKFKSLVDTMEPKEAENAVSKS